MIKQQTTERGFSVLQFDDLYGEQCSIQESSLASEHAIWFGIERANPQILASQAKRLGVETEQTVGWIPYPLPEDVLISTRMHLTREQVQELLPILKRFADTGELYK